MESWGRGWALGKGGLGRVTGKGLGWGCGERLSWEEIPGTFMEMGLGDTLDWGCILEWLVSSLQPLGEAAQAAPGAVWGMLVP